MRPDTVARIFAPFFTTKFLPSPPRSSSSRGPASPAKRPSAASARSTPRVIVMSGYREPDTRRRCADLGAHEFMATPFERAALLVKFPSPAAAPVAAQSTPPPNLHSLKLQRAPPEAPAPTPPS
jgi:hypothetical protein